MDESPSSTTDRAIGVLICDDVDAMRMLLTVIVELRPTLKVVGEARDGNEAISQAKQLQPDVILLDLSMPQRTGLEALPEIKHVAPAARVIVLSGMNEPTIVTHALELGAARYIEKGADPDTIATAIEDVASLRNASI